jgi:hypothetical protein
MKEGRKEGRISKVGRKKDGVILFSQCREGAERGGTLQFQRDVELISIFMKLIRGIYHKETVKQSTLCDYASV